MRIASLGVLFLASVTACCGQWELGGLGGFGVFKNLTATSPAGEATTGFRPGVAWGFQGGHNPMRYIGGEVRYLFRQSDLKLESGGQDVRFTGHAHIVHYDLLVHTKTTESRVRPFLAIGGGIKVFRGTGQQSAAQPLNRFALLTRTREIKPLMSFGGGVKYRLSEYLMLRGEVRDYLTPAPESVIAPAPGARIGGWLHDVVPLVGLAATF